MNCRSKRFQFILIPVESTLTIDLQIESEVSITDLLGKIVMSKNVDLKGKMDVSGLPSGMYFIQTKEGTKTKFIKQ
jgi:hypothetical protein